jgi:hypothetical protein
LQTAPRSAHSIISVVSSIAVLLLVLLVRVLSAGLGSCTLTFCEAVLFAAALLIITERRGGYHHPFLSCNSPSTQRVPFAGHDVHRVSPRCAT